MIEFDWSILAKSVKIKSEKTNIKGIKLIVQNVMQYK